MATQPPPSEDEVLAFLKTQDTPLSGKLVGQRMGFQGRKSVNVQLHSLSKKGLVRKHETKQPPEWSAVGGGASGDTPPSQLNLTALNCHVEIEGKPLYTHESGPDGTKVFTPVRAGDLSHPPLQPLEAESTPQQESGQLVVTSPSNPPAAEVPIAHERNHRSLQTTRSQAEQGDDDSISALTHHFEGIDLTEDSSHPPSSPGERQVSQPAVRPVPKPRSRSQPTVEERQILRDHLQQSDVPLTTVDLYNHLGHSTRSVAKAIVQELEAEGVVRKIGGSDSETDKWEWVRE